MFSDAVVDGFCVVPSAIDVVEADWVDLVESCVEVGQEREIVELKKPLTSDVHSKNGGLLPSKAVGMGNIVLGWASMLM